MARVGEGGAARWDLRIVAAIGAILMVAGLIAFLWLDPTRAAEVVTEDGPVEWVQAAFLFAGWVVIVGRAVVLLARGRSAIPELLLGALLTVGITVELSLHSWVGFRIRHWHLSLRRSAGPVLPWVALSGSLIVGLAAARHVARHRRSLLPVMRSLPHCRWGQLMIAGAAGYAVTQLFEHGLERLMPRPSYFLEESLELVAALCMCLAAWERARVPTAETGETGEA
jgi:hypothetical protein